jgi:hypothetical protein
MGSFFRKEGKSFTAVCIEQWTELQSQSCYRLAKNKGVL